MKDKIKIKIEPRYVKQENGLRPFLKEVPEVIKKSDVYIIFIEAPVGSVKSYIIRNLIQDDCFQRKPIVLTYPTKILMDAEAEYYQGR